MRFGGASRVAAGLAHLKELIDRVGIRDRTAAEVRHADGAVRSGANLKIVGGAAVGAKEIEDLIRPGQHVVSATRRELWWALIWGRWCGRCCVHVRPLWRRTEHPPHLTARGPSSRTFSL